MKLIVSISCLALVSYLSVLGWQVTIDYSGTYAAELSPPEIISDQLELKRDNTFKYELIAVDGSSNKLIIRGNYQVQGKTLHLLPTAFETSRTSYQKMLSRFEAGNLQLQPIYHLRKIKNQLTLCLQDTKTELFFPKYIKKEKAGL